jgi:membrane protease YdiL (CAAX protease family)
MEELLLYLLLLVPVAVANVSERHRTKPYASQDPRTQALLDGALRSLPYALLIVINLVLLGIMGLVLLNALMRALMPELVAPEAMTVNWLVVAAALLLTALLAFLPLSLRVRRWLARWLPIDPDSLVHMTALAFAIYQIGLSLGQIALIGGPQSLIQSGTALTVWDVVLSGLPLALLGLAGVGLLIRRDGRNTLDRLGLRRVTFKQLLAAAGVVALLLGLDLVVNFAWQALDPTNFDLVQQVSDNLFGGLATVGGAIVLGLSAGLSEELLFRGAIQPRLGLLLTAILFAIGHLQYGLSIATLEVFVIGLVLGLMRKRTNTTICILIHAAYNTVGTLLGMG